MKDETPRLDSDGRALLITPAASVTLMSYSPILTFQGTQPPDRPFGWSLETVPGSLDVSVDWDDIRAEDLAQVTELHVANTDLIAFSPMDVRGMSKLSKLYWLDLSPNRLTSLSSNSS